MLFRSRAVDRISTLRRHDGCLRKSSKTQAGSGKPALRSPGRSTNPISRDERNSMTAHVAAPSHPHTATQDPLIVRIVGQASAIRRKHKNARVIGIYSVAACGAATEVESSDGRYLVRPCYTPLAARMATRADAATDETTVIVKIGRARLNSSHEWISRMPSSA